ncbi:MAG: class I SAM-dependent methyltransferase [Spirochaetota bacterium]
MTSKNNKENTYYSNVRSDLLAMLQGSGLRLLEIGCGAGSTLLHAKQQGVASAIVGAEYVTEVAAIAKKRGVSKVYTGDFADAAAKIRRAEKPFDAIIMGDVLEHMVDPWSALALAEQLLVPGGQIVVSIPNFRYWRVMYNVFLRGDFRYASDGIMDKTHLRFFCRRNIVELVSENFEISEIRSTLPKSGRILKAASLGLLTEFGTLQYLVRATKVLAR